MMIRTARGLIVALAFTLAAVALGWAGHLTPPVLLGLGAAGTAAIVWAAH